MTKCPTKRCGKCPNCIELDKIQNRIIACVNPPFSNADDGVVSVWNAELARLPCTRGLKDDKKAC